LWTQIDGFNPDPDSSALRLVADRRQWARAARRTSIGLGAQARPTRPLPRLSIKRQLKRKSADVDRTVIDQAWPEPTSLTSVNGSIACTTRVAVGAGDLDSGRLRVAEK